MPADTNNSLLSLAERHKHILDTIKKEGKVTVVELCNYLNVSPVTIRKDLTLLESKKLLYRIHGGATLDNLYTTDRHVSEKEKIKAGEKTDIGFAAAALVEQDDCIIIGSEIGR